VFDAADDVEAKRRVATVVDKWKEPPAPRLAEWMEHNVPQGLTVLRIPLALRRRLRTTNVRKPPVKPIFSRPF